MALETAGVRGADRLPWMRPKATVPAGAMNHQREQSGNGGSSRGHCFPVARSGRLKTLSAEEPTAIYSFDWILSFGSSSMTFVRGGMLWMTQTLPPITEPFPMTVSPPRIVAPA